MPMDSPSLIQDGIAFEINIVMMNVKLLFTLLIALSLSAADVNAQQDSTKTRAQFIKVKGIVVDAIDGQSLATIMAVDRDSGSGTFGDTEGGFVLTMELGDTLLVGAIGYETVLYGIPINYEGKILTKTFYLRRLLFTLPSVDVIPERELEEIQADIEELGYDKSDYQLSGVDAIASPITFLYQTFSKREASFRLRAELENEDRRKELLKELFQKYVDYDIIELEGDEFDDFIDYCNVSEYFLKNSSQYDFLVHVKRRFAEYKISPAWIKNQSIEDEYYRK
jgi:hypothetical protein